MKFSEARIAKSVSKLDLLPKMKLNWENGIGRPQRIGEPNYKNYFECRKAAYNYNKIRIGWVTNYLKENYPNKDYAEKYQKRNSEYNNLLNYPTKESKICKNHSDDLHCEIKRDNSCFTCCYVCWTPKVCQWSKCDLFLSERNHNES
jgi:hypothetical protein